MFLRRCKQSTSYTAVFSFPGTLVVPEFPLKSKRSLQNPRSHFTHARRSGALLVIAPLDRLDRLARNVYVTSQLLKSRVEFVCCDNPHANRLTMHVLAAMAEYEERLISERTKAGQAAAKARGVKLRNGGRFLTPEICRPRSAGTFWVAAQGCG